MTARALTISPIVLGIPSTRPLEKGLLPCPEPLDELVTLAYVDLDLLSVIVILS
jgi:hypothetical protein